MSFVKINKNLKRLEIQNFEIENNIVFNYFDSIPINERDDMFFRKLIFKGGIFQGMDGFTIAMTTMFRTYMKYAKLIELYENKNRSEKKS